MKKGFIESIENNVVLVIFSDHTKAFYPIEYFNTKVEVDMEVVFDYEKLVSIKKPNPKLKKQIQKLEKELFTPFKNKKR